MSVSLLGITAVPSHAQIKRNLLIVDRILIAGINEHLINPNLQWLESRGLISYWELNPTWNNSSATLDPDVKRWLDRTTQESVNSPNPHARCLLIASMCRVLSKQLTNAGLSVVSLYDPPPKWSCSVPTATPAPGSVTSIVLDAFPLPDESATFEDIINFKEDPDTSRKRQLLQRWTHNLATKGVTSEKEIAQEIEWLLADYEEHMRLHKMKINRGTLETVFVTGAEIAEDLAKFKWGAAAKLLFSASHRKIELLEAEMKAPGRELAYISKARERFNSND